MKVKLTLLVVGILFILLSGCRYLDEGTIVEKWYEPASRQLILIPMMVGKMLIMQQYWIFDDEDWCLKVVGQNEEGKQISETWYVEEKLYAEVSIGEWITYRKDSICKTDPDVKKKAKG